MCHYMTDILLYLVYIYYNMEKRTKHLFGYTIFKQFEDEFAIFYRQLLTIMSQCLLVLKNVCRVIEIFL